MSGRACCGGNGDLCSSEETASNVIALCQSSCCTVTTAEPDTHLQTHTCIQASFIKQRRAEGDKKKNNKVYSDEATKREKELEAENEREGLCFPSSEGF